MAGFPENDIDDEWENDEDEREYARHDRWSPEDDEVESLIDYADCDED